MKKAVLWFVAVLVSVWALLYLGAGILDRSDRTHEWPNGLGSIDEVPKHFPDTEMSRGAVELARFAAPIGVNVKPREKGGTADTAGDPYDKVNVAVGDYLRAQLERPAMAIDPPPAEVGQFLDENAAAIDAVRDHLLHGQPIVWRTHMAEGRSMPIPNLLGHMKLYKVLVTRALRSAQRGDVAAWDDLHASWILSRSLWNRPEMISVLIALAGSRMVNAAAAKMPGSEPGWLAEMRNADSRGAMASSFQAESWAVDHSLDALRDEEDPQSRSPFMRRVENFVTFPYQRLGSANYREHMRRGTASMLSNTACDVNDPSFDAARAAIAPAKWNLIARMAMPNVLSIWQRLARYQAELEATERILQIRRGETPREESQCADGKWIIGGTPTLKFSKEIPVPPPGTKYPLEYTR